ncbi:MAG: preprotein translocase subunit SecY [Eubacteriales bacterium]|nr:preprotein translocase subunit SecY [Eubacteriales bacterium]
MLTTLRNAWKIPELRRKLLFTLFILVIYRLGAAIYIPYINHSALEAWKETAAGSILEYLNIISGDAFSKATLFALSISPYITASIVMQLLCVAIKPLEELSKSGEEGRKKINNYTRYVTVALGLLTSIGYYFLMRNTYQVVTEDGKTVFGAIVMISCYCAGAALIMWLAEKINESGIGNGISIILFANIVSSIPGMIETSVVANIRTGITNIQNGSTVKGIFGIIAVLVGIVAVLAAVAFVVFITESERRLPVQYAKRVVGRKMYGGQNSNLPLKLNMNGVMPIIFASSICSIPATIMQFTNSNPKEGTFSYWLKWVFSTESWVYALIYFVLIILFAYFYTAITFNPIEVANNLQKNGGSIMGIRPGKPTAEYISKILNRVTLIGALFLSIIAVVPLLLNIITGGALGSVAFSGNSLLIVVGVALETSREIEAQMTMRHYKGFLE